VVSEHGRRKRDSRVAEKGSVAAFFAQGKAKEKGQGLKIRIKKEVGYGKPRSPLTPV